VTKRRKKRAETQERTYVCVRVSHEREPHPPPPDTRARTNLILSPESRLREQRARKLRQINLDTDRPSDTRSKE
jgi:hypothetical protein